MKTKNTLLSCLSLSLAFALCASTIFADTPVDLQPTTTIDALLADDTTPSETASKSLRDFFVTQGLPSTTIKTRQAPTTTKTSLFNTSFLEYVKQAYNHRTYSVMLSQDASDIRQFLEISTELNLDADHTYVGMRLFKNKLKECEVIEDAVIHQLLANAPHLEHYFEQQDEISHKENVDFLKQHTENIILHKFTEHFTRFQASPDLFVQELSHELATFYNQHKDTHLNELAQQSLKRETLSRLRNTTIQLLDIAIGKVIWDKSKPEAIWPSLMKITNGLHDLAKYKVIEHMDDLDDLTWTLTHRFSYFLELIGNQLPLEFYTQVENSLIERSAFFLEAKEQDDGITSKKQVIIEALLRAKTAALAEKKGIYAQNEIV